MQRDDKDLISCSNASAYNAVGHPKSAHVNLYAASPHYSLSTALRRGMPGQDPIEHNGGFTSASRHSNDIFANNYESPSSVDLQELMGLTSPSAGLRSDHAASARLPPFVPTPGSLLQQSRHLHGYKSTATAVSPPVPMNDTLFGPQSPSGADDLTLQPRSGKTAREPPFEPVVGYTFQDFAQFEQKLEKWSIANHFMVILLRSQRPGGKLVQATFGCFRSGIFKSQAKQADPISLLHDISATSHLPSSLIDPPLMSPQSILLPTHKLQNDLTSSHAEYFQKSLKTNCPFQINVRYSPKQESYHITKILNEHNHALGLSESQILALSDRKIKRRRKFENVADHPY